MRLIAFLFLALALTGAPFGMGRMMDTAHAGHAVHAAHGAGHTEHGQPQPDHPAKALHFTMCAACVAALPQVPNTVVAVFLTVTLESGHEPVFSGVHALPLTPPPRA